jgi:hypothetical protein
MSVQNIHEMDRFDRDKFLADLEDLLPGDTLTTPQPSGTVFTWASPKHQWSIEVVFNMGRYIVRGGENKWVRFDDDLAWLRMVLKHFEAIG